MRSRLCPTLLSLVPLLASCAGDDTFGRVAPRIEVTPEALDFGSVPSFASKYLQIQVANRGTRALTVSNVEASEPFAAIFSEPLMIAPGTTRAIDVAYRPVAPMPSGGRVTITSDAENNPSITLPLDGIGEPAVAEVRPGEIEWLGTTVGAAESMRLVVTNRGVAPLSGSVALDFERAEHFALEGSIAFTAAGETALPFNFAYRPTAPGDDSGRVMFEICGARCGLEVIVHASATESSVRLDPPLVDFGAVGIRQTAHATIFVKNEGTDSAQLTGLRTRRGGDLSFALQPALPATISPGGALEIRLDYTPLSASSIDAEVLFQIDSGDELRAPVIGRGEGPLFRTYPELIDFGTASRGHGRRSVLLANEGSSTVEVKSIELSGDPAFSLGARPPLPANLASGESLIAYVEFEASELRRFDATLSIRTDDEENSRVDIPVVGIVADVPCDLDLAPERVDFGLAAGMQSARVRNMSLRSCLLERGEFEPGSSPAFRMSGVAFPIELAPDQEIRLDFEFAPELDGEASASFVLVPANDSAPARYISLSGFRGEPCNGTTPQCSCPRGQVKAYRRFDIPLVPSGVFPPAELNVFNVYCVEAEPCAAGQVKLEVERDEYACVDEAPSSCAEGTALDAIDGELTCVPCDLVVRYGFIFDGARWCTEEKNISCPGGGYPIYDVETRQWGCAVTCGGVYDPIPRAGGTICIPC